MYNYSLLNDFYARLTSIRRSPNTIASYRTSLEHWFPSGETLTLTPEYIDSRMEKLKHLSNNSLKVKLASLAEFLRFVHRKQRVDNLDEILSICSSVKAERKESEELTEDQIKVLMDSCRNIKDKCIMKLLYCTGVRISELVNLKVSDVSNGKLRIRLAPGVTIKNNQERTIPLPKCAREILEMYLQSAFAPTDALFVGTTGKPVTKNSVQQMFLRLSKATGIDVHAHSFRHSFITRLLRSGVDLKTIQSLTGQSSGTMVLYYANTSDELKDKAVSLFDSD